MTTTSPRAGVRATIDVREPSSVQEALTALGAARETILREDKMLFVQCHGGPCPEVLETLLAGWDYQAIAQIPASSTLCFARATLVASGPRAGESKPGNKPQGWLEKLEGLPARADAALRESSLYEQARGIVLELAGRRPKTLRGRKLQKLIATPDKFLEDSKHELLSGPGLRVARVVLPAKRSREVTLYDFPKRTLLVCVGEGPSLDAQALAECTRDLGLRTELVVVLSSGHADDVSSLLSALRCPRVRIYVMAEGSGEDMLHYGLARTYSTNVAVCVAPLLIDGDALDSALGGLTREHDHVYETSLGLVAARREVWRDFLAGERRDPALSVGVSELLSKLGSVPHGPMGALPKLGEVSDYSRYAGVAASRPFDSEPNRGATVTCYDRKPVWPHPPAAAITRDQALISVVMTVYNAADTVGAAIASVLSQTYKS